MAIERLTARQLEVFLAVADGLSFTDAARHLHISQSAVSVTIRAVEKVAGVGLIERDTRNVALTAAGERLRELALDLQSARSAAARDFQAFLDGSMGQLVIAALPSVTAVVLPKIVSTFTQANPQVQVHLRDRIAGEVIEDIRAGVVDLGITATALIDGEDLSVRPFLDNPLVAVLPPGHRLLGRREVEWADLVGERFVGIRHGSVQPLIDRAFATLGVRAAIYAEVSSIQSVAGLVAASLGVSALPRQAVPLIGFSQVEVRPLVGPVMTQQLALAWARSRCLTPVAQRWVAYLYDYTDPIYDTTDAAEGAKAFAEKRARRWTGR